MNNYQECPRQPSVCQLDWELHIDGDGVVTEVPRLLDKIFSGGCEDNIRSEVWKYLLGYYKWHHPTEIQETNKRARVEEYFRYSKSQTTWAVTGMEYHSSGFGRIILLLVR